MINIELQQGSPEWHQFRATKFTASDAPAMLGLSKYKTRQQLLHEKATGLTEEVTTQMQVLFDKGHAAEAAARPIVEAQIGKDLYPVTGVCDLPDLDFLAASFDGLTMCDSINWENKLWNEKLVNFIKLEGDLPDSHWPQVEHQIIVSGSEYCLFTVSDGTESNTFYLKYKSTPERRKAVIDGWIQFAKDLSVYVPEEKQEAVKSEVIRDLPALIFNFDRTSLTIQSNFTAYKKSATDLVEKSKQPLESDQDFANAESMVKFFKTAEEKLLFVSESVIGEVVDIDKFIKDVKEISESIRAARLNTEKQVKTRKESIKLEIVQDAKKQLSDYIWSINESLEFEGFNFSMPEIIGDFAGAIKGKKTVQSLKDACSDELARAKIEVDNQAAIISRNADCIQQHGKGLNFLFNDFTQIYLKDPADFILLVQNRVANYEFDQKQKSAAEKLRQDELNRQQEASAAQQEVKQPEPAQPVAEKVKTEPASLQEAKQGLSDKLGDVLGKPDYTLSFAISIWAEQHGVGGPAQESLIELLESYSIDV